MSIKVNGVSKVYGKQKALDNVSFNINSGEIVGFIGTNGAGKTSMMKLITGYMPATSARVMVDDVDVMENSLTIRKNIGYLPEHNPLYLEMYVKEYLVFVAGLYNLENASSHVKEIIEMTGLIPESNKKIGALSKGYRQRVGLAQSLIHDPGILILDEPTSGLDPNQIIEIRNLISKVGEKKTVMLSTHIMQEVEAICDRIIIIDKGKIVADDAAKSIYSRSKIQHETLVVEFNQPVLEEELKKINGVIKALRVKENNWIIEYEKSKDIREDIFNYAVQSKKAVLSLQKKEKNLEDLFHELTGEN